MKNATIIELDEGAAECVVSGSRRRIHGSGLTEYGHFVRLAIDDTSYFLRHSDALELTSSINAIVREQAETSPEAKVEAQSAATLKAENEELKNKLRLAHEQNSALALISPTFNQLKARIEELQTQLAAEAERNLKLLGGLK